ncbi:response regulator [Roseateles cavernae]|uniref:response regulator n=1 Tax=Roseateles cavernae TaxID=3153578 RepID=UPI0032E445DD
MKHRILVVEDQPGIRKLIQMSLELGDYEVYEAPDGDTALIMAAQIKPDAVLLDVMMPGTVNGLQVCERMKRDPELGQAVVIMLSARGHQTDIDAGAKAGADAYLVKPFSPLELIERLETSLAATVG